MTFKIIEEGGLFQDKNKVYNNNEIAEILESLGYEKMFGFVYEHKNNTTGVNYIREELDEYIASHNKDPADEEQGEISSITELITSNISKFEAYQMYIPEETSNSISQNYKLYLLMKK